MQAIVIASAAKVGRRDLEVRQLQILGRFIAQQHGKFAYKLAEFLGFGVHVAQQCHFVVDQRMLRRKQHRGLIEILEIPGEGNRADATGAGEVSRRP